MGEGCRWHGHRLGLGSKSKMWVVPPFALKETSEGLSTEKVIESIEGLEVRPVKQEGVWVFAPDVTAMIEEEQPQAIAAEAARVEADLTAAVKQFLSGRDREFYDDGIEVAYQ